MSCAFSREMLALHVEGDLSDAAAATTVRHLAECEACQRFLEELHVSQGLMKSVRRETVSASDCTAMRHEVMAIINERRAALGWGLRIERAIALGLRPSFGLAALLLLGILSVSMLAQMRLVNGRGFSAALGMPRPEAYRDWILVSGSVTAEAASSGVGSGDRVYINPSSYREYTKTGKFPDGTMLVWEAGPVAHDGPHTISSTLLVSFKDSSKFEGGWGFFDFSGTGGGPSKRARALPESRGCGSCHRQSAKNDHVFTQFHPGLRSAVRESASPIGWGVPV